MLKKVKSTYKKALGTSIVLIVLFSVICVDVFAWFYIIRRTRTGDMEIDIPPIIYVKNDNLDEMTSFDLDGLQINETYTTVFCVSPAFLNAVHTFELGIIYTENIGMEIDLHPVEVISDMSSLKDGETGFEEITRSLYDDSVGRNVDCYFKYDTAYDWGANKKVTYNGWTDTNETNTSGMINRGVYKLYSEMTFEETYEGTGKDIITKMNDVRMYRFFVLRITWPNIITDENLEKEADIVYIVTNGTASERTGE